MARAGGGSLTFTGALDRGQSLPPPLPYAAAQGLLGGLVMAAAKGLGPLGVRVTSSRWVPWSRARRAVSYPLVSTTTADTVRWAAWVSPNVAPEARCRRRERGAARRAKRTRGPHLWWRHRKGHEQPRSAAIVDAGACRRCNVGVSPPRISFRVGSVCRHNRAGR